MSGQLLSNMTAPPAGFTGPRSLFLAHFADVMFKFGHWVGVDDLIIILLNACFHYY